MNLLLLYLNSILEEVSELVRKPPQNHIVPGTFLQNLPPPPRTRAPNPHPATSQAHERGVRGRRATSATTNG